MFRRVTINIGGGKLRYETLEGRRHAVVPAASLAEGVWEGSDGAILYLKDRLAKSTRTWDHKPIVVYHPKDSATGQPISACDPTVLNTRKIGVLLNNAMGAKLTHECWIDVDRSREVDARVMDKLEAGETVEVSTGLSLEADPVQNEAGEDTWTDGKKYKFEGRDFVGDHLAVLPDRLGAYSVADGGGMGTKVVLNEAGEPERNVRVDRKTLQHALARVGASLAGNELSFGDTERKVRELLANKYGEKGRYWRGYVHEVYPGYAIFCNDDGVYPSPVMMQKFTVKGDEVELDGDATEVVRSVEYKPVNNQAVAYTAAGGKLVLNQKEKVMAFDKKAHVAALIGNGWEEKHRAALEAMPDDVLENIKPVKPAENQVTGNQGKDDDKKPRQVTLNDLTDPDDREMVEEWRRAAAAEKGRLVDVICNSKANAFNKDWLLKQKVDMLRGMAALAGGPARSHDNPPMFTGAVGAPPVTHNMAAAATPADVFLDVPAEEPAAAK
jgi:hypothetical protein